MSIKSGIIRAIGRLARNRDGNVLIMSALLLPILIGMAALVTEYGSALVERADNQRIADLSAYAGALAYNSTKSTDRMTAAAVSVATLNGIPAADVQASLVASPKTSGMNAVSVSIRTQKNLLLARVLQSRQELQIYAGAVAELGAQPQTPGCVLALDGTQTGVTLSGGTTILAPSCTVASNNTVTVPCGTTIQSIGVNYNSTAAPSQPCNGITGPNGTAAVIAKKATNDPLAGNTAITGAVARIATVAALTATTAPTAPTNTTGGDLNFGWSTPTNTQATAIGCTATFASSTSTWTLDCTGKSTVNIGTITIGGGINLNFATNGAATTTYNIAGDLTTSATTSFGPGTYNFAKTLTTAGTTTFGAGTFSFGKQVTTGGTTTFGAGAFNFTKGIVTGGGATTTFGAGTFKIGISDNTCGGISRVSLCNTSKLTFGGPSTFEMPGGFMNTGGSNLTFGSGTGNSYKIGPGSNGDAITLGGGSYTIMGDATDTGSVFQVVGNVNGGGGGSCFVVSAAAQHDIAGNFMGSGAILLGAGIYTVDGYFTLGSNGGGSATCNGSTISVSGANVTLVLSGKNKSSAGSCNGYVFCVAAGYSNIVLTAPQTGTMAKLAVIGPTSSSNTGGATFAEGGSNAQISGAFYFPYGPVIMNGGSSVLGSKTDTSKCLQLIGSRITLSGGTAATSECIAASGATAATKVSLVQ
ncbi:MULTISPECIES: TadE/TadG family type IV pilus assembly protein [unclassified Mesorhizobium]|uniref:TadE/TadG family type IV pilus assembly protein n=1 Tax=unclassified Mesorhizobium TaxID=325217 RepID=UPI000B0BF4A2|nr:MULTISPECIES: TadE/TadG family type IV pilus assembly protein [unclassified Mesorhizobium]